MVDQKTFDSLKEMWQKKADECPEKGGSQQFVHPDFPFTTMCKLTIDYESPGIPRRNIAEIKCPYIGDEESRIREEDPSTKIYFRPCYLQKP
jgi:hypothetical protein